MSNGTDCATLDGTVWSAPSEVAGEGFATDDGTLSWNSLAMRAGPATVFDVMRGLLFQLPVGGGAAGTRLAPGTEATPLLDTATPTRETWRYYLIRGANGCGTRDVRERLERRPAHGARAKCDP